MVGQKNAIMPAKKGFTLIELLVVIAIIALLMAILMPALHRVKSQARAVTCQTNLRQWALVFSIYMDDNDGYFAYGDRAADGGGSCKTNTETEN
jgi:prepilin-type N-terminal cleavage/methylation domain-containing protein